MPFLSLPLSPLKRSALCAGSTDLSYNAHHHHYIYHDDVVLIFVSLTSLSLAPSPSLPPGSLRLCLIRSPSLISRYSLESFLIVTRRFLSSLSSARSSVISSSRCPRLAPFVCSSELGARSGVINYGLLYSTDNFQCFMALLFLCL